MFAIVEVGGKQYRMEEGAQVVVDRVDAAEGATVELPSLLVADGGDLRLAADGKAGSTRATDGSVCSATTAHVAAYSATAADVAACRLVWRF